MAINNKNVSGLGYDPLAWLAEEITASDALPDAAAETPAADDRDPDKAAAAQSAVDSFLEAETPDADWKEAAADSAKPESLKTLPAPDDPDFSNFSEAAETEADYAGEAAEAGINLEAALSMQHVAKLHERLKKAYDAHDALEINASRVVSIDTASLQVLAALKKDALKHGKRVVFAEPSPRFIESAGLLGLNEFLDLGGQSGTG